MTMRDDEFYDYDENQAAPSKKATGNGVAPAPTDLPLTDAELAALTDAGTTSRRPRLPGRQAAAVVLGNRALELQVFDGKDRIEVAIAEDDEWVADVRSYCETWKGLQTAS